MYFNQLATPTANHLSMNQHQTIPKNKAATNPYQHQKEMPNPPLNINLRLPEQIIKEHIAEEKKKKIKPWLKPSIEKLWQQR